MGSEDIMQRIINMWKDPLLSSVTLYYKVTVTHVTCTYYSNNSKLRIITSI